MSDASMEMYLDEIFPKRPFLLWVPPLWHALEKIGSEIRPKGCVIVSPV